MRRKGRRRRCGSLVGELVRRRDVTKVRDGGKWRKRIREAPEELDGVGDAFSCSFEPDHGKNCHQGGFSKIVTKVDF